MKNLMVKGMLTAMNVKEKAIGMKTYALDRVRNRKAQGMVEWMLIVGLIAIFVIGALVIVGLKVKGKLGTISSSLN